MSVLFLSPLFVVNVFLLENSNLLNCVNSSILMVIC
ncbi:hypothetical protein IGI52_000274 [Enterococcus sp. DIV0187]